MICFHLDCLWPDLELSLAREGFLSSQERSPSPELQSTLPDQTQRVVPTLGK